MPGYMRRPIHRHAPVAPSRPATLADLARLTPSESLALARHSAQHLPTPHKPRSRTRAVVRAVTGPMAMLAVLVGGTALASLLTGGHPF